MSEELVADLICPNHSFNVSLLSVTPQTEPLSVTPTNTVAPCALAKTISDSITERSKEVLNSYVLDSPEAR
jgi:hypothetical protein